MPSNIEFLRKTPADLHQARNIQHRARMLVETKTRLGRIKFVAGADVGFENNNQIARGAIAVLRYPSLELVEYSIARLAVRFPYIPGYLSFREAPVLMKALRSLAHMPDVILCDGQGLAHPRRFGLACHLGLAADVATVGVAKSRLIGSYKEPAQQRGSYADLSHDDQRIGRVLRTRTSTRPLFISTGHRIGLVKATNLVLACSPRFRLPETTRAAHRLASGPRK